MFGVFKIVQCVLIIDADRSVTHITFS